MSSPIDLSRSEIPRLIQQNLIAYMSLFAELLGVAMHDDGELLWFVSNKSAPGNNVLRSRWRGDRAAQKIDLALEAIGRHTDWMDWLVFPEDEPADLGTLLEDHGMPGGPGGNWLWIDLKQHLTDDPHVPGGLCFRKVRDDRMMAEWVAVSQEGFGADLGIFYDAYARHGYGSDARSAHYTGYMDGTPVTSATLLDAGGCAAIYDVSTPPRYRRRGIGAAITYYLLREIRSRGYADTWIWSSSIGKGVYQRLGFVVADFGLREYKWRKSS